MTTPKADHKAARRRAERQLASCKPQPCRCDLCHLARAYLDKDRWVAVSERLPEFKDGVGLDSVVVAWQPDFYGIKPDPLSGRPVTVSYYNVDAERFSHWQSVRGPTPRR